MAIHRSLDKITFPLSHLPTWFFIIGYPLFWVELYTRSAPDGVTSMFPWVLFGGMALYVALRNQYVKQSLQEQQIACNDAAEKMFWTIGFVFAFIILGIVMMAGLKPLHLMQEFDCLQYHYTLPRQHLILGSFAHIPWAADDLFLLPMDFALAPFWFAAELPNKIPQLIIFFGLIIIVMRLTNALAGERRPWAGPLAALVILGTHGFTIQMGTGMLDLAVVYLFLASLDSLRRGRWILAAVEFTFFFWSKPLMPLEVLISVGVLFFVFILVRNARWQIMDTFVLKDWKKASILFIVLSVVVAGPFIAKSIYYAATPFFPLGPGMMGTFAGIQKHPLSWHSLQEASRLWMVGTKNGYGHGRGLISFITHWWFLAVPEKGVNNSFDYPLGLTYLLVIGPFLFFFFKDILQRKFSLLSMMVIIIWGLWWFTAQQSRFLYLPLFIMFIVTIARFDKIPKGFFACLLISLLFETLSLWGAHRADMGRWGVDDLRDSDKQLVALDHRYLQHSLGNGVDWPSHDAAYAQFPLVVHKENLPHTILF